jgi:hypothetical protein
MWKKMHGTMIVIFGKFPLHVGLTLDHTKTGNRITSSNKTGSHLFKNLYIST